MKRYNVIILAGGEKGPLFDTTGFAEKALLPIHGKPMVSRVIEAFHLSQRTHQIVVVGSRNLRKLEAMQWVRKRIPAGWNLVQNVLLAVTYVKHRLYRSRSEHDGYVISFCDAVFLTPEIIDDTLSAIESSSADVVLHYVEKATFEAAGLPTKRTYLPIGGKLYTGTTIYYVRRFRTIFSAIPKLSRLRRYRKDPQQLLAELGCEGSGFEELENALGQRLKARVKFCVSPHAEMGIDVDKPADLELAQRLLGPAD